MTQVMYGSVTRIATLPAWPFPFEPIEKERWAAGDYVVAEVRPRESRLEGSERRVTQGLEQRYEPRADEAPAARDQDAGCRGARVHRG